MPHTLTPDEANALHFHALALRPDWSKNSPGATWKRTLTDMALPQASSYLHALAALTAYCLEERDGRRTKRTPNLYPLEGSHWNVVPPPAVPGQGPGARTRGPWCEDHPTFEAAHCACCIGDVKLGQRPQDKIGKRFDVAAYVEAQEAAERAEEDAAAGQEPPA